MIKFKKVLFLILLTIFISQEAIFCLPDSGHALRPPLKFNYTGALREFADSIRSSGLSIAMERFKPEISALAIKIVIRTNGEIWVHRGEFGYKIKEGNLSQLSRVEIGQILLAGSKNDLSSATRPSGFTSDSRTIIEIVSQLQAKVNIVKPTEREKYYIKVIGALKRQLEEAGVNGRESIEEALKYVRSLALENVFNVIISLNLSPYFYHRLNMLLWGINVEGEDNELDVATKGANFTDAIRYKQFEVSFESAESRKLGMAPLRLSQRRAMDTPYTYTKEGEIEYYGSKLSFDISEPRNDQKAKRYHGYYFPHFTGAIAETPDAYYELRLNPINRGTCPGGSCLFCERVQKMPTKEEIRGRYTLLPDELVSSIAAGHPGSIEHVELITLITEAMGTEQHTLNYIERLITLLQGHGFKGRFSYAGHLIRSEQGIRKLKDLGVDYYEFTLEAFTNRDKLMGRFKGIPIEEVRNILRMAKTVGFTGIGINYIEGLDRIEDFETGIGGLAQEGLINFIGHNIMVPFASFQEELLVPEAKDFEYYLQIRRILDKYGIQSHDPVGFEKGSPFSFKNVSPDYNASRIRYFSGLNMDTMIGIVTGKTQFVSHKQLIDNIFSLKQLAEILEHYELGNVDDFEIEILEGGHWGYSISLKSVNEPAVTYVLKTSKDYTEERIRKQQQVLSFLASRGFPAYQFIAGKGHKFSCKVKDNAYALYRYVQGQKASGIKFGAQLLAEYFKSIENMPLVDFDYMLDLTLGKSSQWITKLKDALEQSKDRETNLDKFDYELVSPWVDFLETQVQRLHANLVSLGFYDLPDYMIQGDFRKSHIFIDEDNVSGVIDFDAMRPEKKIYEIVYAALSFCDVGFEEADKFFITSRENLIEFIRTLSLYYPISPEEIRLVPEMYRALILQRIFVLPRMHGVNKEAVFKKGIAALEKIDSFDKECNILVDKLLMQNGRIYQRDIQDATDIDLLKMMQKLSVELRDSKIINYYEHNQIEIIVSNLHKIFIENYKTPVGKDKLLYLRQWLEDVLQFLDSLKDADIDTRSASLLHRRLTEAFLMIKAEGAYFEYIDFNEMRKALDLVCDYMDINIERAELVRGLGALFHKDEMFAVEFLDSVLPIETEIRLRFDCKEARRGKRIYHVTGKTAGGLLLNTFLNEGAHSLDSNREGSSYSISDYITEYVMPKSTFHNILANPEKVRVRIHIGMPDDGYIDSLKQEKFAQVSFREDEYEPQYRNRLIFYREGTENQPADIYVLNVLDYTGAINLIHFYLISGAEEITLEDHFPDYTHMLSSLIKSADVKTPVDVISVGSSYGSGMSPQLPRDTGYCYFQDYKGMDNPYQFRWLRHSGENSEPAYLAGINFNLRELSTYSLRLLQEHFPEARAFLSVGVAGFLADKPGDEIKGYNILPGDIFIPKNIVTDFSKIETNSNYLGELIGVLKDNKISYVVMDMEDKNVEVIDKEIFDTEFPTVKIILGNQFSVNSVASETKIFIEKLKKRKIRCIDMEADQLVQSIVQAQAKDNEVRLYLAYLISDIPGFVGYGEHPAEKLGRLIENKIKLAGKIVSIVAYRILEKEAERNKGRFAGRLDEYRSLLTPINTSSPYYLSASTIEKGRGGRRLEYDFWTTNAALESFRIHGRDI